MSWRLDPGMPGFVRAARYAAALAMLPVGVGACRAAEVRVAVAANFTEAAQAIGKIFARDTGHHLLFSFGSTGQLATQISQAAPFDAFLAADQARPRAAVEQGLAIPGSDFTYALGKLALYSATTGLTLGPQTLKDGQFAKLAIANPVTAPYGAAAIAVLKQLGLEAKLAGKLVRGNNVAQTFQFVTTGNADLGFVALAQIARRKEGSRWIVPQSQYQPIAQDAVLLKRGAANPAAKAFLTFLRGETGQKLITSFGYGIPAR